MSTKHFITSDELERDSLALAHKVHEDQFCPTMMVGLWRGGAPVGMYVQEYLAWKGVAPDHIAVRTSSYTGIDEQAKGAVQIFGLDYVLNKVTAADRILIVDDIFDTGRTAKAIVQRIRQASSCNNIRVATLYYKPKNNATDIAPDYFVRETGDWVVFPHELVGLSDEEISLHKPFAMLP